MATAKRCTELVRESEVEAYLVKRVREAGGITYKFVSPGHVGVPDRIIIINGEVSFVEVKAPGKLPTALQLRELKRIAEHFVPAGWVSTKAHVDHLVSCLPTK